ncbi:putative NADPH-quinone reductase (modulator of drug activity B) [Hartmannibacter diazotrophicus]|uniref:Putative NADPH-quinone reductase (Modulator of drug activity B) n=2 Tax=Hartmannibacter diazotrophicus TaxID=1482074 RepID=A0A2C9DDX4_9HYPH|nr:putative NADPH-quinone reductase (modulator of drug activity B) [Hartmannibacter diazotrophicus]
MPRSILLLDGHPDPDKSHLCHALADAYGQAATAAGHTVRRIDLAGLDFPLLRSAADFREGEPPATIADVQAALLAADHLVIVFPLWLGGMPALLRGLLEQTLRPAFAFEDAPGGWPKGKLKGRSVRLIVTMGMPAFAYRFFFLAHGVKMMERNILKFVGMGPVRKTYIGMVEELKADTSEKILAKIAGLGRKGE